MTAATEIYYDRHKIKGAVRIITMLTDKGGEKKKCNFFCRIDFFFPSEMQFIRSTPVGWGSFWMVHCIEMLCLLSYWLLLLCCPPPVSSHHQHHLGVTLHQCQC